MALLFCIWRSEQMLSLNSRGGIVLKDRCAIANWQQELYDDYLISRKKSGCVPSTRTTIHSAIFTTCIHS